MPLTFVSGPYVIDLGCDGGAGSMILENAAGDDIFVSGPVEQSTYSGGTSSGWQRRTAVSDNETLTTVFTSEPGVYVVAYVFRRPAGTRLDFTAVRSASSGISYGTATADLAAFAGMADLFMYDGGATVFPIIGTGTLFQSGYLVGPDGVADRGLSCDNMTASLYKGVGYLLGSPADVEIHAEFSEVGSSLSPFVPLVLWEAQYELVGEETPPPPSVAAGWGHIVS